MIRASRRFSLFHSSIMIGHSPLVMTRLRLLPLANAHYITSTGVSVSFSPYGDARKRTSPQDSLYHKTVVFPQKFPYDGVRIQKNESGGYLKLETVLLYNIKGTDMAVRLKPVLLKLKIRVRTVAPEEYLLPVGSLLKKTEMPENGQTFEGTLFTEPMMVMCGFTSARLDLFLRELRKNQVPFLALKAVLTPENQSWSSLRLHEELSKEHEAMQNWHG